MLTYDLLVSIFQTELAAARRRRDRAGRPGRGRRLLPAAHGEPAAGEEPGHAASRGDRAHRGERRDRRSSCRRRPGAISLAIEGRIERGIRCRPPARAPQGAGPEPAHAGIAGNRAGAQLMRTQPVPPSRPEGRCRSASRASCGSSVAGEQVVERGLRVPLELQNLPAGLEIVGPVQDTVDVRVRGASEALSRLVTGDLVAMIDLRRREAGTAAVPAVAGSGAGAVRRRRWRRSRPSTVAIGFEQSATQARAGGARRRGGPGARATSWARSRPSRRPWRWSARTASCAASPER